MKKKAQIEYEGLLKTGMFHEFYPHLSGNYEQDKESWKVEYRKLKKQRKNGVLVESNVCPVCELPYGKGHGHPRRKSRHHIFCKKWYPDSTLTVDVCQKCHDHFNSIFMSNATRRWSKIECVRFWCSFCYLHDKVATKIYPQLLKYV